VVLDGMTMVVSNEVKMIWTTKGWGRVEKQQDDWPSVGMAAQ